ncbi:NTP transferase domain-containing protein [Gordonia sp. HNM0687]|uniref:NTP transferase domain-containing protein n=1 Tax=Gordonia mangrovi TaxID=2665643 RepID=A0A6L7GU65_9ACTN|nr:NTP transferase domain-containing protein [Gordonia mangrovi]MXP23123.1 NTP transferase domain-containing protein [Gordonia mangrovi]UVF80832.1 NTP transferase domain-containing protein [Gordonia mangrovi]
MPAGGAGAVCGVVLAAGAGRRYGMPKILAHEGKWLTTSVDALRDGGCDEVVVAMGASVVEPPVNTSMLYVDDWAAGLSASVRAATHRVAAEPDFVGMVLHVVDTPDVGPEVTRRVIGAAGRRRDAVARAVFDGRPGHPVYIGADHFAALRTHLRGDSGAGRYLAAVPGLRSVECGDLATGRDRDLPE